MSADARTVSFRDLLRGTAHRCGLDPDQLAVTEAAALAEHLTLAAKKAWQHYDWPDVVRLEKRLVKPEHVAATTYANAAIVYSTTLGGYYTSQQGSNTNHALTDVAWWKPTATFALTLDLVATGENPMSEILGVWDGDPDLDGAAATATRANPVGYRLTASTVALDPGSPNTVWVRFRLPAPLFSSTAYSTGTAYASGDVFYYTDGDCYLVTTATTAGDNPVSHASKFRVQTLPILLDSAVKRLARAEWLSTEEQEEKAIATARRADEDLDDATAKISDAQGQTRRYGVLNSTTTSRLFQPRRTAR